MIVEAIVGLVAGLVEFIGSLFGAFSMPGWWADVDSGLDYLVSQAGGFNNWFPLTSAVNAIGLVVVCLGVAIGIKLVRIVASFFTAGGGSAA